MGRLAAIIIIILNELMAESGEDMWVRSLTLLNCYFKNDALRIYGRSITYKHTYIHHTHL